MQLYINYIGKNKAWDLASLPSSIHNFKMNLGHIKYHLFPSNNIAFFCLTQLSVDVFFMKLQHSGGRSERADAAPHNTPQNTNCVVLPTGLSVQVQGEEEQEPHRLAAGPQGCLLQVQLWGDV